MKRFLTVPRGVASTNSASSTNSNGRVAIGRGGSIGIRGPIIAISITSMVTFGAIYYSHYSQEKDKRVMRAGVERDKERLRIKKLMMTQQQNDKPQDTK